MSFGSYQHRSKVIKKIIFWSLIVAGLLGLLLIQTNIVGFAQPLDACETIGGCGDWVSALSPDQTGSTQDGITALLLSISRFLVFVGAAVAIFFIVLNGFKMVTSNGNDDQYKKALKGMTAAVIGLVTAILSFTAIAIVGSIVTTSEIDVELYIRLFPRN